VRPFRQDRHRSFFTTLSQAPISFASALALQSDGKIVAAGNTGSIEQRNFLNNFAVARYLAQ
jgi:hypothetical protein